MESTQEANPVHINLLKRKNFTDPKNLESFAPIKLQKLTNEKKGQHLMKIMTWNVGGLRAAVRKGTCIDYIHRENPDIVVLTQIRCHEKEVPEEFLKMFSSYYCRWLGAVKGQAGIGVLSKERPLSVQEGLPGFASTEGRLLVFKFANFSLVGVYVPNSGRGLKEIKKRMLWDNYFYQYLWTLVAQTNVVVSGDLNVCLHPIDLANPVKNERTAGFTVEERRNFQEILEMGLVDAFRHLYPTLEGAYTYWNFRTTREANKGWRLDYHLVSESLVDKVRDCVIQRHVKGSNHCPVVLYIEETF